MTTKTKQRLVPAKVASTAEKQAVLKRATTRVRPKVRIDFKRSVRGQS